MTDPQRQKTSRLGRGLSSLIGEVEASAPRGGETSVEDPPGAAPMEISVADIRANPTQPRRHFDEAALDELAESIRTKGVLQAILVRPDPKAEGKFQIVAGERRWRAAKKAGLTAIPAVVRELDELALLEVGIIENVQRTDLNPMEEAEAYDALMKRFGRTQESLAESVGKSRAHIANTLRLLNLPEGVRDHLRTGRLSAGHARAVLTAPDPEALAQQAVDRNLSVRDVEGLAKRARDADAKGERDPSTSGARGRDKDVDTQALEADLTRALGLTVDIRHTPKGGELRIKYRDLEQLDDVCRKLSGRRNEI